MHPKRLKILMVIEQCNPEWASVPLLGYRFFEHMANRADVTLVTHIRNRSPLEKCRVPARIEYISEHPANARYYRLASSLTSLGAVNWPLQHALTYSVYAEFNRKVYQQFSARVQSREFDLVHVLTPILPRYPVKLIDACRNTPFILGPVNGGIPFPKGFEGVARQEFAHFNILRGLTRLIPGYRQTYQEADKVLAGSSYTLDLLSRQFPSARSRMALFFENGIPGHFFQRSDKNSHPDDPLRLLFVGRLVPYKGADMLIDAVGRLSDGLRERMFVSIVGDGPQRMVLESQAAKLNLGDRVCFTGWIPHAETARYYRNADLFCFPSLREFGGAVVLEAMASGLPCLIVNHGGIGEYVTEDCGIRIFPGSREEIVTGLAEGIEKLGHDASLRSRMADAAQDRAREFEWNVRADALLAIYQSLCRVPKRHP